MEGVMFCNSGDNFMESNTYKNLKAAFSGETSASGKYAIYANKAREDGYQQIGNIFDETSKNEREHAEVWLKLMHGGEVPSTLDNLQEAFRGEYHEWTTMYMDYAEEARREGYPEIARLMEGVAAIERHHDEGIGSLPRILLMTEYFVGTVRQYGFA
jgi:rubrerythrin